MDLVDAEVRVRAVRQRHAARGATDLFHADDVREVTHAGAAELRRHRDAEQAEVAELAPQVHREFVVAIDVGRTGRDLGGGEAAHRFPQEVDVLTQAEVEVEHGGHPGVAWSVDALYIVRQSDYPSIGTRHDRVDPRLQGPAVRAPRPPAGLASHLNGHRAEDPAAQPATGRCPADRDRAGRAVRGQPLDGARGIAPTGIGRARGPRRWRQATQGHSPRPRGDRVARRTHPRPRRRHVHRIVGGHARGGAPRRCTHRRARHAPQTSRCSNRSSRQSRRPAAPTAP